MIIVYDDCSTLLLPLKHTTICFFLKYYFLVLQCEIIIASKCFGRLFKNFPEKPQFTLEIVGNFKNSCENLIVQTLIICNLKVSIWHQLTMD